MLYYLNVIFNSFSRDQCKQNNFISFVTIHRYYNDYKILVPCKFHCFRFLRKDKEGKKYKFVTKFYNYFHMKMFLKWLLKYYLKQAIVSKTICRMPTEHFCRLPAY